MQLRQFGPVFFVYAKHPDCTICNLRVALIWQMYLTNTICMCYSESREVRLRASLSFPLVGSPHLETAQTHYLGHLLVAWVVLSALGVLNI